MTILDEHKKSDLLNGSNYSLKTYQKIQDIYVKCLERFYICLIDIEKFRCYNYFYGYEYGNVILSNFFKAVCIKLDMQGYVFRVDGDRLLILIPAKGAYSHPENIEKLFEPFYFNLYIDENRIRVNFKAGISAYPDDSKEFDIALSFAEIALNYAKKISKVKCQLFKSVMYKDIEEKGRIFTELDSAFNRNEFKVHYQPLIDTSTMKVYGMEALIRWNSPKLGMVSPTQFIRVLEKSRMINEVGRYVFNEACSSIMQFQKLGYSNLSMSINVSQVQLEDTNFLSNIDEVLEQTSVNPELISIEITERIIMSPTENIMNILKDLRRRGIKIYIDDFGTEYSSLNYLYKLPIDGIKIDKSFIDRIDCSEKELIILKNIINIARELNIDLVAEGVEKKEQLDSLLQIKCPKIQGYFFGKPVCSDEFIKYLI